MEPNETGAHGGDEAAPAGARVTAAEPAAAPGAHGEIVGDGRRGVYFLATIAAGIFGAMLTLLMLGRPAMPADPASEPAAAEPATDSAPASSGTTVSPSVPKWSRANQQRWVSNHRTAAAFELPAENTVAVWMDRVRPSLVVRCLQKGIDVFVVTDTAAAIEARDDDHTVRIAFDEDPADEERWPDSVHHDALFAPDGAAFARRLGAARTLRFGFTPHNAVPVTVAFDLTGVGAVVNTVARTCRGGN